MLRSFNGTEPQVADSAYVDETAVVIGDVVIEDEASVWPNTTSAAITGRSSWEREPTSRITPSSTRRPNSSPIRPSGTAPSFTTRPSPNER